MAKTPTNDDRPRAKAAEGPDPKPRAAAGGALWVKAKAKGYYGEVFRKPGDVFPLLPYTAAKRERNERTGSFADVLDKETNEPVMETTTAAQQFSPKWMVKATPGEIKAAKQAGPSGPPTPTDIYKAPPPGRDQIQSREAEDENPTGDEDVL